MNYNWNWSVFFREVPSGGATYVDWLLSGLGWTLAVAISAWLIAFVLGSVLGVLRTLPSRFLSGIATTYVEVFRNIPLLVQLFIWFYVVPELLPREIGDAIKQMDPTTSQFMTAFIALGLFTAARVCEQVRAGIESLARGQKNAGLALGLTLGQTYRHVLLPMAFRVIIPPLTSEFLNIFKNSAVALTIGLLELTAQSRQISEYTAQTFEAFIAATVLYLIVTMIVMLAMRHLEKRVRVPGYIGAN
ncbi:MAG: amino acid ABC transporter permease [Burkholderiales bacterium]|nr:amino acid ABC transporter permease [Burkholderiales bacterium]